MEKQLTCSTCGRSYLYNSKTKIGHTLLKCNSCNVNERRFIQQEKINAYKTHCQICGYSKNVRALQFHHLNQNEKDFNISGGHCRKWESIEEEIKKCICVCANCHIELHNPQTNK